MSLLRPVIEPRVRVPRLVTGLVLCGLGVALMVAADLGLSPWAVLDQGISRHTGIPIGTVSIIVGALVLLAWMPLRERPGLGTVLNVVLIGVTIDIALLVLDTPEATGARVAYLALGLFLWGPGSGLYIGAGLGPGPRDGLMTGLSARGVGSIRVVRTAIEVTALGAGWLLGGSVGLGTLAFAVTIGPNVQAFLPRLTVRRPALATDGPGAARSEGPVRADGLVRAEGAVRADDPVRADRAARSDGGGPVRSDGAGVRPAIEG